MKKLLIFLSCTLAIVIISDMAFGIGFTHYVKTHNLPGRFQPLDKLIRQTDADILFVGNSVIQDAINPSILQDSLRMSCYNGGIVGQDLDFFETVIDCVLQRYSPKMIVLGLRPEEIGENIGNGIYDVLRPYYHIGFKSIDEHFTLYGYVFYFTVFLTTQNTPPMDLLGETFLHKYRQSKR